MVLCSSSTSATSRSARSWIADYNDPMTFLDLMKSDTGQQNYGDYKSPAYDALLGKADNEPDAQGAPPTWPRPSR